MHLRRLEDVIWIKIHTPCALRGHPRSLSCLCKKVTKEAPEGRTTGPSFRNLLQRRGSRPMKCGVTMKDPHTAPRLRPGCCVGNQPGYKLFIGDGRLWKGLPKGKPVFPLGWRSLPTFFRHGKKVGAGCMRNAQGPTGRTRDPPCAAGEHAFRYIQSFLPVYTTSGFWAIIFLITSVELSPSHKSSANKHTAAHW